MTVSKAAPPKFSHEYCDLQHSTLDETVARLEARFNALVLTLSTGATALLMFLLREVYKLLIE